MKSLIQFSFFFLLISPLALSQWTNQNPVPDGNDLWSTYFVDDSTGWIVGSGGFIKKTTSAGNEWIQQNSGTSLILKSVQFIDYNTGWICGEAGLILKTTDGGTTWDSLESNTNQHLTDLQFCTPDTGYVTGFAGTILKTTNGGLSWVSLNTGTTNDLYAIDFVDELIGYAVGGGNDTVSVLKTTDGGISWIDKSREIPFPYGYLLTVDFIDSNTGFVGSGFNGPLLYKTTDGGDTWVESYPLAFPQSKEQLNIYPNGGITSIYFKDTNNGWYVFFNGADNYIYSTTDAGVTWYREYRAYWQNGFRSIFITQNGTGWAVGRRGLICLKENNSSDWSQLFSGLWHTIYSIHFDNKNVGWAAGFRHGNPGSKLILKTTNGGKIWKTQIDASDAVPYIYIFFINELIGWVVRGLGSNSINLTTDGGINWTNNYISLENDLLRYEMRASLFFINENLGWDTGQEGGSWIVKSTDGGNTWTHKSNAGGLSVFFIDQNYGWVVGDNGIFKSTDGGETWTNKSNLTGSCVKFYDSNIGMCVGGESVLVSTDGGETWITKNGPILQTINFNNSTTVWGYTSEGTVYKTTNFGDSWETLNTGLGFGETAFFVNEYTGWVGGTFGTLFKYSVEPPVEPVLPVWSNQITVKDADGTESGKVLIFGQHIDATDSIDASLGEYEIPPPPPSSIFDARFNLPTNPQVSSWIDYRDSVNTDILWNITFQPGSAGYPITLTWDSTSFPEGTFYLKDRINGSFVNVNMKNQSSYTLTNSEITSLKIIFIGLSKTIFVKGDWNIISVPLIAEDMSVSNLFPSASSSAFSFHDGYITVDTLETGVGYWIKFEEDEQIQIYGLTQEDIVPVQAGWNIIGVLEKDIPVNQLTSTPTGIIATYFFGYNDGYYIADTLKSGQGYWARITQDGVLNLNGSSLKKLEEEIQPIAELSEDWGKINVTNSEGKSVTLYAAEVETNLNLFELPPLPPSGAFDVRYSSGRMLENLNNEQIIQIRTKNYPVTIKALGIDLTIRDVINGKILNAELKNGEELKITDSRITAIEVLGKVISGVPVSYELYQNYPNPFNPVTTIKFALPKESNVNISIYNILGELVTTLVNGQMKAGYYEYEFNASQFSSGVYIYKIKADNFIQSKKMTLMK
ncbi:MAG: YCF48-related protein [Ignavibacteriaceae bacterium]|jgi:photosystem II stability/assembly factor-like uncharacterized protein|nr:YCF48-related protein [Ignavibacteriaceae bacterium]